VLEDFPRGSSSLVHEDLGALLAPVWYCREKSSQFWYEESGSSTRWRRIARDPIIMIGIFLLQDIDEALTPDHVDPASFRVVIEVVRIANNFGRRHYLAAFRAEDQQSGRRTASNKQPMMSLVERHWETRLRGGSGPTREDRALHKVGNFSGRIGNARGEGDPGKVAKLTRAPLLGRSP
jgi:hypothetical protein